MAHGDYDCCAVCDCKMGYAGYAATTKEDICHHCREAMHEQGISPQTVKRFIEWIEEMPVEKLKASLDAMGYDECCYSNPVDDAVRTRLAELDKERE